MAAYFDGSSEFQLAASATPDGIGMQTLYLMNPNNYVPYSDSSNQPASAAATNYMFFLNPASAGNAALANGPPPLVGLPLPTTPTVGSIGQANSDDPHRPQPLHGIVSGHVHQYNLWGSTSSNNIDHHQINSPCSDGAHDVASSQQQLGIIRRHPPPAVVVSPSRQGLSLSLSTQHQHQHVLPYNNRSSNNVETDRIPTMSLADHDMRISGNSPSSVTDVISNGIINSKYLRAAQELLDEVVNVGKLGIIKIINNKESVAAAVAVTAEEGENGAKRGPDQLTIPQKQELQMKKAKLVTMLDQVEQRYRQYHHQMQIVVSSFEQAAGSGAAKSYTSLALQAISKQFRCLKDAISGQIKATSKSLGEEDCLGAKVEGSSRLRYVDHQLRQQRALQQLGMAPQHNHNAWRPQRGLPERAVSVLRAWLFEHFLHPYPKDSDKHMLAKQTGLTRSQVSNWFINARVRLWKPMVEEMYLEEVKDHEIRNCSTEENAKKSEQKESGSSSCSAHGQQESHVSLKMDHQVNKTLSNKPEKSINQNTNYSNSTISTSLMRGSLLPQTAFNNLIESSSDHQLDHAGAAQRSPKNPRNINKSSSSSILPMDVMEMKQGDETLREINNMNFGAFGTNYPDQQQLTPRFHHGNSVSLTLGLTHCENHHNFQLERRLELAVPRETDFCGINTTQQVAASHSSTAGYDNNIEMQNRKRFAAQLLPDEENPKSPRLVHNSNSIRSWDLYITS